MKDWQAVPNLRLEFDLELGRLNGVRLTEPLTQLSFFGPVEDRSWQKDGDFRYYSLGLSIGCCNPGYSIGRFELIQNDPA